MCLEMAPSRIYSAHCRFGEWNDHDTLSQRVGNGTPDADELVEGRPVHPLPNELRATVPTDSLRAPVCLTCERIAIPPTCCGCVANTVMWRPAPDRRFLRRSFPGGRHITPVLIVEPPSFALPLSEVRPCLNDCSIADVF